MKKLFILILLVSVWIVHAKNISIINPRPGTVITSGERLIIKWKAVKTTNKFKLTLWKNRRLVKTIKNRFISRGRTSLKSFPWIVNGVSGTGYQIKITELPTSYGKLSGRFEIKSKSFKPAVIGISPLIQQNNPSSIGRIDTTIVDFVDYQLLDIYYMNGAVFAKIKSLHRATKGNITLDYKVTVPFSEQKTVIRRVNIAKGQTKGVLLFTKNADSIGCGLKICAIINPRRKTRERDYFNNEKCKTVYHTQGTDGEIISVKIGNQTIENGGDISLLPDSQSIRNRELDKRKRLYATRVLTIKLRNCGEKVIRNATLTIYDNTISRRPTLWKTTYPVFIINRLRPGIPFIKRLRSLGLTCSPNSLDGIPTYGIITVVLESKELGLLNKNNIFIFTVNKNIQ